MQNKEATCDCSSRIAKVLPLLAAGVLNDAAKDFHSQGTYTLVSDHTLLSLASVFGTTTARALDLLDGNRLFQYQSESGLRRLTKVNGRTKYYTVLDDVNYCQCEAFRLHVLNARDALTCQHVLAVKLAVIASKIRVVETISDQRFKDVLNNSMSITERH